MYETLCDVDADSDTLECDEVWAPLASPSQGDLKRFGLSGADPNHLPKDPKKKRP
ncbi:hypothetical protein SNARM312S_07879 [Streptomyces narbonensis]